jgi:RNA polymerase sigma factor (sigma-70 family)
MSLNTRITLLNKLKSSYDDQAWADFHSYYYSYLSAVISRLNVNKSDVDDIVQKVMLVCWKKVPEFEHRGKGHFRSWLVKVARNNVMNFMNSSSRYSNRKKNFTKLMQDELSSEFDETAEKEWRVYLSKLAWQRIKDNYQSSAQSSFDLLMKGMSNKEVAVKLSMKENTVAVFKRRILESLKEEILQLDEFLD